MNIKALIFIVITLFAVSCMQNESTNNETEIEGTQASVTDTNTPDPHSTKTEVPPAGMVIDVVWPDGTRMPMYFFTNGHIAKEDAEEDDNGNLRIINKIGTWTRNGDEITINYYKKTGNRGVGNLMPPPPIMPNNYIPEYEDYVVLIEDYSEREILSWKELETEMTNDGWYQKRDEVADETKLFEVDYEAPGKYPQATTRALTKEDVKGLSKKELSIMRNEIFARYGYGFKNKELLDYFADKTWYVAMFDNVDHKLSKLEKQNIELIKEAEMLAK